MEWDLKIAFLYGDTILCGRWIDFNNVWDSPRGLTGSELSYLSYAKEMSKRGHQVCLYIHNAGGPPSWEGIEIRDISQLPNIGSQFDVAYAWHEPDLLRHVHPPTLRMINQQLNDFNYAQHGFDQFVDVYTSPSESHREYFYRGAGSPTHPTTPSKWEILSNGCDPTQYTDGPRVPGRIIYASSPDRGLHLLLQTWPLIKKAVPEAHLRIFYNIDDWLARMAPIENHQHLDFKELSCRARYVRHALERMNGMDVEKIGSSSRRRIAQEFSQAMVLAYPCDTINFTEGFSVTTMEACASGVYPVISSVDSLGQIYRGSVPMIESPVREHLKDFSDLVIRGLKDEAYRKTATDTARAFADKFRWSVLTEELETIIARRRAR